MKIRLFALALTALTLTPIFGAEDSKTINPALLYWQAAAKLPPLSNEQATELVEMATGQRAFDAAKGNDFLKSEATLRLLRKGAESTADCDWGLPTEDGPATLLPHLAKMRQMSSLAIVQAEALFAEGKVKEGIDWLLVAHRMARHAGSGDFLISYLVQVAMETSAIHAAARHCLAWDAQSRHEYAAALKALPPLHSIQTAFNGERIFIDWVERHAAADGKPDAQLQAAIASAETNKPGDKEALATLRVTKTTIASWRDLQDRVAAAFGKPWSQAQPELKALTDEAARSPNLLVRIAFPTTTAVAEKNFILATLQTMLDAALQHGPQLDDAAAATYHDSLEGEPLRLQKDANGTMTLMAARQHPAGKDLSLQLGK
ncbi:hypothetical protein CfE428DRAFT_1490 [Chthoniobacter flavus Ellin428]|uniref:Uncharacterized protein n=1 Tax=Chthoniobacter flavus Ellin428 TaxID=497964 RepID=B4CY49_9BACT|nr:hypothetical protein [Chthoniobacter flavus]EDY21197.1 hypothetical protein CfE428DRAFT_1490 [Chthoniobacter flavus Ellin428]TCO87566.1 hypothetical protein EV701_12168 [Chthoniobacter flavus]